MYLYPYIYIDLVHGDLHDLTDAKFAQARLVLLQEERPPRQRARHAAEGAGGASS